MAVLSRINCESCGEQKDVMHGGGEARPKVCSDCRKKALTAKRERDLAELNALSVEERLRRVEAWIYDYRPQYVDPPRF